MSPGQDMRSVKAIYFIHAMHPDRGMMLTAMLQPSGDMRCALQIYSEFFLCFLEISGQEDYSQMGRNCVS